MSLRYWHTLRYLKPVQIYGRMWFKLRQPKVAAFSSPLSLRVKNGKWRVPIARKSTMFGPSRFKFLNVEHSLGTNGDWNNSSLEKLWLYNLHYFDDLNAADAHSRKIWHVALMQRWIAENPLPYGNGWEPYPTSIRIVNWIKWALAGNTFPLGCAASLATQTRWLSKRLEVHLLGNHLVANAKALVFAGLYFDDSEAENWLRKGLYILERELPEQVLADGGNFERSPMYHAMFLEDLLDLLNITSAYTNVVPTTFIVAWQDAVLRMLEWLHGMSHPDGQIALFNDAAFGISATAAELAAYADRVLGVDAALASVPCPYFLGIDKGSFLSRHWADTGYIRMQCAAVVALLDVAPIGPDYLPGHAHADTLSFELSVFGQRVIVNGGTSRYGIGLDRLRERQTASHSTVEVDGKSSSEVWGGFRVARRAYPFDLEVSEHSEFLLVACSHDGYKRLPGKPVHRRSWQLSESCMEVIDTVSRSDRPAVARYILNPDVKVERVSRDTFHLELTNGRIVSIKLVVGSGRLEDATFAPEFGKVCPTQCIAVDLRRGKSHVRLGWS